jgi:hypothetical protein
MINPLLGLLPDFPYAGPIWLTLVSFAVLSVAVMVGRLGWLTAADYVRMAGRRARLAAEANEVTRYAEEVAVAAQRAAATAQRHRQDWLAALATAQEAARALDAAEAKVRRLSGAAALPAPLSSRTPTEYADRERYLHRAAMSACARGHLSIYQLSDALAHRNGWDPRLHPACQEVVLSRASRDHLAATHATAVARESAAWQTVQSAIAAAYSLRNEALAAAWRAQRLRAGLEPATVTVGDVVTESEVVTQVLPIRPVPQWQPAPAS